MDISTIRHPLDACGNDSTEEELSCRYILDPKTGRKKLPGEFSDFRIVVLINRESASAAEVFACTMQGWGREHGRFMVVGERSYGKGVGQMIFYFQDGSGLWLTAFEFLCGNPPVTINKKGVIPDYYVFGTDGASMRRYRTLQKAIELLRRGDE